MFFFLKLSFFKLFFCFEIGLKNEEKIKKKRMEGNEFQAIIKENELNLFMNHPPLTLKKINEVPTTLSFSIKYFDGTANVIPRIMLNILKRSHFQAHSPDH